MSLSRLVSHPNASDFRLVRRPDADCLLRRSWEALAEALPFRDLAESPRGTSHAFRIDAGTARVKRRCRGGLLAPFLPDLYSVEAAAARWLSVHAEAMRRALPVPNLVGLFVLPPNRRWASLLVATAELQPSVTLADRMKSPDLPPEDLRRLGAEVRALHESGFLHGDLNAMNILLPGLEAGYRFVDLDRARFCSHRVSRSRGRAEAVRLARSVHKTLLSTGRDSTPLIDPLFLGYANGDRRTIRSLHRALARAIRLRGWRR
ncbi:MAG: hypothetical protein HYY13_06045 [Nitrospirae bacterium]|nr:hypothetical protein [Nitrospirota bacterium]